MIGFKSLAGPVSVSCGQLFSEEAFVPSEQNSVACHGGLFYIMLFKQNLGPQ